MAIDYSILGMPFQRQAQRPTYSQNFQQGLGTYKDLSNLYHEGQKRQKLSALGQTLKGEFAKPEPNRNVMLGALADYDPQGALRMFQGGERENRLLDQWKIKQAEKAEIASLQNELKEIDAEAMAVVEKYGSQANVSEFINRASDIERKLAFLGAKPKLGFKDQINMLRKQAQEGRNISKEGRSVQKHQADIIKDWKNSSKQYEALKEIFAKFGSLKSTVRGALQGKSVPTKNLLFAISRLGSNEAINEGDLRFLASQNIFDQIEKIKNARLGTGTMFSPEDVKGALMVANDLSKEYQKIFDNLIKNDAPKLAQRTGLEVEEVASRMQEGIDRTGFYVDPSKVTFKAPIPNPEQIQEQQNKSSDIWEAFE